MVVMGALLGALLAPALPARAADASEAVLLRLKGTAGQEVNYRSEFDFSMNMEVNEPNSGTALTVKPHFSGWSTSTQRVTEVAENGDLTLTGQLQAFDLSIDLANAHLRLALDSAHDGMPQLIKIPALPFGMVMSNRGQLRAITGLDKLPIPPLPMGPEGAKLNLPELINKALTQFSMPSYPEQPVKVGDTWNQTLDMDIGAMVKSMGMPVPPEAMAQMPKFPITLVFTFVGYETLNGAKVAVLKVDSPWKLEMPAGGPGGPGAAMIREGGQTTVMTRLDVAAGRLVRQDTTMTMEMSVSLPDGTTPVHMSMRGQGSDVQIP